MPKPLEQELLEELTSLAAELGSSAAGNKPGQARATPNAATNKEQATASNGGTNTAGPQAPACNQHGRQSVLQRAQAIADSHRIDKKRARTPSANAVHPQQVALPL